MPSTPQGLALIGDKVTLNATITDWLSINQIYGPDLYLVILGYALASNDQKQPDASVAFACHPPVTDVLTSSTKPVPIGNSGTAATKQYSLLDGPAIQLPSYNCLGR